MVSECSITANEYFTKLICTPECAHLLKKYFTTLTSLHSKTHKKFYFIYSRIQA